MLVGRRCAPAQITTPTAAALPPQCSSRSEASPGGVARWAPGGAHGRAHGGAHSGMHGRAHGAHGRPAGLGCMPARVEGRPPKCRSLWMSTARLLRYSSRARAAPAIASASSLRGVGACERAPCCGVGLQRGCLRGAVGAPSRRGVAPRVHRAPQIATHKQRSAWSAGGPHERPKSTRHLLLASSLPRVSGAGIFTTRPSLVSLCRTRTHSTTPTLQGKAPPTATAAGGSATPPRALPGKVPPTTARARPRPARAECCCWGLLE